MHLSKLPQHIKSLAVPVLYYTGFFDLMRYLQRRRVTILMYHRFSATPEPFKVSQNTFEQQIRFLKRKYNIIKFSDYVRCMTGKLNSLPRNSLIITIDDGYEDNYLYAFPVLKKYNIPATIFLTTDFIFRQAWLWPNKLEYILKSSSKSHFVFTINAKKINLSVGSFEDWHRSQLTIFNELRKPGVRINEVLDDLADFLNVDVPSCVTEQFKPLYLDNIREMQQNHITFGSHTCSHPILSNLDKTTLIHELSDSKNELESALSTPVNVLCYPNGTKEDFSKTVVDVAVKCGYKAGVTTIPATNNPICTNPFLLSRYSLNTAIPHYIMKELTLLPVYS